MVSDTELRAFGLASHWLDPKPIILRCDTFLWFLVRVVLRPPLGASVTELRPKSLLKYFSHFLHLCLVLFLSPTNPPSTAIFGREEFLASTFAELLLMLTLIFFELTDYQDFKELAMFATPSARILRGRRYCSHQSAIYHSLTPELRTIVDNLHKMQAKRKPMKLPKRASVLVPFCMIDGQASLLFTMRTETVGSHKGQGMRSSSFFGIVEVNLW